MFFLGGNDLLSFSLGLVYVCMYVCMGHGMAWLIRGLFKFFDVLCKDTSLNSMVAGFDVRAV